MGGGPPDAHTESTSAHTVTLSDTSIPDGISLPDGVFTDDEMSVDPDTKADAKDTFQRRLTELTVDLDTQRQGVSKLLEGNTKLEEQIIKLGELWVGQCAAWDLLSKEVEKLKAERQSSEQIQRTEANNDAKSRLLAAAGELALGGGYSIDFSTDGGNIRSFSMTLNEENDIGRGSKTTGIPVPERVARQEQFESMPDSRRAQENGYRQTEVSFRPDPPYPHSERRWDPEAPIPSRMGTRGPRGLSSISRVDNAQLRNQRFGQSTDHDEDLPDRFNNQGQGGGMWRRDRVC